METMETKTKQQAIYDNWGCTEERLAKMFPKGTKVELAYRNHGGWKTCSIFFEISLETYNRKSEEYAFRDNENGLTQTYHSWRNMAMGALEIEVDEIFGDVVINNGWDAKRYAKQLADRLGWEWVEI